MFQYVTKAYIRRYPKGKLFKFNPTSGDRTESEGWHSGLSDVTKGIADKTPRGPRLCQTKLCPTWGPSCAQAVQPVPLVAKEKCFCAKKIKLHQSSSNFQMLPVHMLQHNRPDQFDDQPNRFEATVPPSIEPLTSECHGCKRGSPCEDVWLVV